jgi:hypothetical protein
MIAPETSFEFSPGSEKHREALVLADDLRGVVNAAFTNLPGSAWPGRWQRTW